VKFINFWGTWIVLWLLSLLAFSGAWNSGLVFDCVEWYNTISQLGWKGFAVNFNDLAVRYFFDLVSLIVISLFKTNLLPYFILYTFLHATAAFQIYLLAKQLIDKTHFPTIGTVAFIAALLFVVSPYTTETVIWKVGLIYLLATNQILLLLQTAVCYFKTLQRKYIAYYFLVLTAALLTHEIAMFFPFLIGILGWKMYYQQQRITSIKPIAVLVLPGLIAIGAYLLLNQLVMGVWLGHYGAKTHFNFNPVLLASTFNKYLFKFAFLSQLWKQDYKLWLYHLLEKNSIAYASLFIYSAAAIFLFFKKLSPFHSLLVCLASFFALLIAPVLNLYFLDWMPIHGDRLGYTAAAFFYLLWVSLLWYFFKEAGLFAATVLFILQLNGLQQILASWHTAENILTQIHQSFTPAANKNYVLLAAADNYKGAYMFRCRSEVPFAATLQLRTGKNITDKCVEVLKFNMANTLAGVAIEKVSDHELKMYFTQDGSWWWRNGQGAENFETADFSATIKDNTAYINFKNKKPNTVYLYQQGNMLKVLDGF